VYGLLKGEEDGAAMTIGLGCLDGAGELLGVGTGLMGDCGCRGWFL